MASFPCKARLCCQFAASGPRVSYMVCKRSSMTRPLFNNSSPKPPAQERLSAQLQRRRPTSLSVPEMLRLAWVAASQLFNFPRTILGCTGSRLPRASRFRDMSVGQGVFGGSGVSCARGPLDSLWVVVGSRLVSEGLLQRLFRRSLLPIRVPV